MTREAWTRIFCFGILFGPAISCLSQTEKKNGIDIFRIAASESKPSQPTASGVVLLGGAGDVDEATRFLCDRSHGGELVVFRASGRDEYNPYFHQLCPENSVSTFVITSPEGAKDPSVVQEIRNAHAIFIAGGDQSNYVNFWSGNPLQHEINQAVARGVPIAGISAGLAVLGEFAFSARQDTVTTLEALANPYDPKVALSHDFLSIPVLKGIISDSHFSARERMGRTVTFLSRIVQDGWAHEVHAIGVDEATAVLVDDQGRGTVVGKGSAYFLTLQHRPEVCLPGRPLTVHDVNVYKLAAGPASSFDLRLWSGVNGSGFTVDVVDGKMSRSDHH